MCAVCEEPNERIKQQKSRMNGKKKKRNFDGTKL